MQACADFFGAVATNYTAEDGSNYGPNGPEDSTHGGTHNDTTRDVARIPEIPLAKANDLNIGNPQLATIGNRTKAYRVANAQSLVISADRGLMEPDISGELGTTDKPVLVAWREPLDRSRCAPIVWHLIGSRRWARVIHVRKHGRTAPARLAVGAAHGAAV